MWQVLNPDSGVPSEFTKFGTFTIARGGIEIAISLLTPFYQGISDNFWTPGTAREAFKSGCTYPEVQPWNFTTPVLHQQSVRAAVQPLCGVFQCGSELHHLGVLHSLNGPKVTALSSGNPGNPGEGPATERTGEKEVRDTKGRALSSPQVIKTSTNIEKTTILATSTMKGSTENESRISKSRNTASVNPSGYLSALAMCLPTLNPGLPTIGTLAPLMCSETTLTALAMRSVILRCTR
ncbi:MAG: hypothetical protein M1839_003771 [Geoglossum umbratile]|nr:MAG: hypothetical protein M1839_003771 [Geoglossum umbratile]